MQGVPTGIVPVIVVLVVGWRLYWRFRRNIGRQLLRPRGLIYKICLYAVMTLFLGILSFALARHPEPFEGLAGGVVTGALLGLYGLHLTRFEKEGEAVFYTPNPYMGAALLILLAARLAYRFLVLTRPAKPSVMRPELMQSPLTMFLFGLLAGYYMTYYAGVLRRNRKQQPE